jgi:hypothetical protein
MKYALHSLDFDKLRLGTQPFVSEVILPLKSQYDAIETIQKCRDLKLRVVWRLDAEYLIAKPMDDLIKECKQLLDVYGNMAFIIPFPNMVFAKRCPNVIFSHEYAAKTYSDAMSLFGAGVSEIYVTGSLAMDIESLKKLRQIMLIRMIPNLVQADAFYIGNPGALNPFKCFWLRPEAVALYDGAVSVMEFVNDETTREEGLLAIYSDEEFGGNLGDIIIDETGLINQIESFYDTSIDRTRTSCKMRCHRDDSCHTCDHIVYQAVLSPARKKSAEAESGEK